MTVPAPSHTVTVVSRSPRLNAVINISLTPKFTKTPRSNLLCGVNIPSSLIRYSIFFLASCAVSFDTPAVLLNTGHHSAMGSPTSTTLPSFTTTRVFPKSSITCGISIPRELVKLKQFSCFYLRYSFCDDLYQSVNMFFSYAVQALHSFKYEIHKIIQFFVCELQETFPEIS